MEELKNKILRPSSLGEVQTWKKYQYAHPKWEAKTSVIRSSEVFFIRNVIKNGKMINKVEKF